MSVGASIWIAYDAFKSWNVVQTMRIIIVYIAASFLLASASFGAQIDNLYMAKVNVADRGEAARTQGIREGFLQVLVRVTGQDSVRTNAYVRSYLSKAQSFLQRFSYEKNTADDWQLILHFDATAVQNFLADAQLPVWQSNRPLVMLWLATEEGYERFIVEENSEQGRTIAELAERRALPVILPLMDLEDTTSIEVSDVWGRFMQPVMTASARYQPDVVVAAKIERSPDGQWTGRGQMFFDGRMLPLNVSGEDFVEAVDAMLAQVAAHLSQRYAVLPSSGTGSAIYLKFNTPDVVTLAKIENYLEGLLPVQSVHTVELSEGSVTFRLRLAGSEQAAMEAMALDGMVRVVVSPTEAGETSKIYEALWQGAQ